MLKRNAGRTFAVVITLLMAAGIWTALAAQHPTGVVQAASSVGGPLSGMTSQETTLFQAGQTNFNLKWDPFRGLGIVFTQPNCNNCHACPNAGGSSAGKFSGTNCATRIPTTATVTNTEFGKTNSDGSFNPLTSEGGPFLHPQSNSQFSKIKNCPVKGEVVPSDATIVAKRTSPANYGDGLIDAIPDATILANAVNQGLGIQGVSPLVPDEFGALRPGRFGRKDQEADLIEFIGNAMVHELGITNFIQPNEDIIPGFPNPPKSCSTDPNTPDDLNGIFTLKMLQFIQFLAPNPPGTLGASGLAGKATFESIGCNKCHIETMTTASSVKVYTTDTFSFFNDTVALANQTVALYSDLLLHNMGSGLSDGVTLGAATSGAQFRTEPLWGLSLRTVYLHDGRTSNLTTAIKDHGGEAATVISNFNALSSTDQANLLTFLNSL